MQIGEHEPCDEGKTYIDNNRYGENRTVLFLHGLIIWIAMRWTNREIHCSIDTPSMFQTVIDWWARSFFVRIYPNFQRCRSLFCLIGGQEERSLPAVEGRVLRILVAVLTSPIQRFGGDIEENRSCGKMLLGSSGHEVQRLSTEKICAWNSEGYFGEEKGVHQQQIGKINDTRGP